MMKNLSKKIEQGKGNIIFNIAFMVISILIVVIFFKKIMLTNGLLILLAIIGLFKWKSKLSLIIFIFFGVIFGMAEIMISGLGLWRYSVWDIANIPSWLFILWGNTALFIHQMIKEIKKFGIKK
jgi:hypothetical protein